MSDHKQEGTQDGLKTLASLIGDVRFAMLTTLTAEGHLHSRPLTTQQTEFDGDVWFIVARDGEAVADIQARPQVNVSYAHPGKGAYVSLSGQAELVDDPAKLDELWSDAYKAFFPQGKADPNLQLIKIHARGAEYWEGDGKVRTLLELAKGLITGQQADLGEHDTVKL